MKKSKILQIILWMLQGFLVGLGAILPGVSGGTLCYVFGIYEPVIDTLTNPLRGIKKYWFMLMFVGIGGVLGFVGFAGITEALLRWNTPVVLCVFIGLILGTVPELWRDSGEKGRNKYSIISLCISFVFIVVLFYCCEHVWDISIPQSILGYAICGVIWGLSFIIPGFSSSTLLLFFGIYGPMSAGIKSLDLKVVVPLGLTMLATLLLLSRAMKAAFEKIHSIASHSVMGFVLATTLMLFTVTNEGSPSIISTFRGVNIAIYICCIVGGAVASFLLSKLFDKLRAPAKEQEENN